MDGNSKMKRGVERAVRMKESGAEKRHLYERKSQSIKCKNLVITL